MILLAILITMLFLIKFKKFFYIFIPLISILFDLLFAYIEPTSFNVNIKEILLFIIVMIVYRSSLLKMHGFQFFFLIYIFLIVVFSSTSTGNTYKEWVSIFINIFLFTVAIYQFRGVSTLKFLNYSVRAILYLAMFFFFMFQFTPLKPRVYYGYTDEVIMGSLTGFGILFIPFCLLILIQSVRYQTNKVIKYLDVFLIAINIAALIIIMNRTSIIAFFLGLFIFLILEKKVLRYSIRIAFFIPLILFFLITNIDLLRASLSIRSDKFDSINVIEEEDRYLEYIFLYYDRKNAPTDTFLFGEKIFKSRETFGKQHFDRLRPIHSDFNTIFYGGGLIGLLLYLALLAYFFYSLISAREKTSNNSRLRSYLNLAIVFVIMIFIINLSGGGLRFISTVGIAYIFMGTTIGISYRINNEKLQKYKHFNVRHI